MVVSSTQRLFPFCPPSGMPHLTSWIILLCILSEIGCAESRQRKRDDHGLRPQSRNEPDRLSQRSNVHLDLDYNRLLESFGISENGSDIEKNQESIEPIHRKTKDLETGRCQILQCDHGRLCRINIQTGVEECVCRKRCSERYNPVCGSDGKWYHNHCSLHRASCIEDHPVHIVDPPGKHCDQQITTQSPKNTAPSTRSFLPEACSVSDYAEFKSKLLLHFYDRFLPLGVPGTQSSIAQREILRDIWDILDGNKDNVLDQKELNIRHRCFEFASPCRLDEILRNEDLDGNDQLDFHELLMAYGLGETPSTWPAFPPRKWTAIAGNSIELPCDIIQTSGGNITWERNRVVLNGRDHETGLHINGRTGTLYATHLQLIHSGNYSCFDEQFPDAHQTHHLVVVVQPEVEVEYRERFVRTGQNVSVKCHTAGVPQPTVRWLKNDEPIKNSKNHITDGAGYLRISNVQKSDTAVYKCVAESEAGRSSDSTSLFVMDHDSPNHAAQKLFVVFFAEGISAYDADQCGIQFHIEGTSVIPGTRELLCGNNFAKCNWGSTVNVLDRYIYASQPLLNRVLVLSLQQMLIVQIVHTDNVPVKLNYVPHLDQVWIVCWRSTADTHSKTIQLVRDASQKLEHSAIHLEPLHGKYQTFSDFFPPPIQELAQNLPYTFASGSDGKSLVKIDMRSIRTIATVDLGSNGCRPQKVTYSTIGNFDTESLNLCP
ncbi:hypothetical protein RvY_07764-1 [Ramazzottius varieornatus]|uniref:Follistatin-related protein 5 n=1 Tax=Ramazzottius varieornatus TaxID=947166 RepID=A0A1D1V3M0_RAMVA|nr:hypothetical protein RvY_07764-1 [Ramazzottius varieornatus]